MSKYDPKRYDDSTPARAKEVLKNFEWNYVVLADESQDDGVYKINRTGLDQQKAKLEEIAGRT